MPYLDVGCRTLIALIFVLSVTSKLRSPARFAAFTESLRAFGVTGSRLSLVTATAVVLGELLVPAMLAFTATARVGLLLATVLLASFTVAIARVLRQPTSVPCRCFGPTATPVRRLHLVRNLLLIVTAVGGLAVEGQGQWRWPGLIVTGCVAAVTALILAQLDQITDLFAAPTSR